MRRRAMGSVRAPGACVTGWPVSREVAPREWTLTEASGKSLLTCADAAVVDGSILCCIELVRAS